MDDSLDEEVEQIPKRNRMGSEANVYGGKQALQQLGYKRVMKRISETTPAEPPPAAGAANWLSGEERSRLEAVQRDWRLSRPYKVSETFRNIIKGWK